MEKQNETEGKLSELPACAAEFIKLVINKMRYRKKVREDVQAELAAHFEDELKGIKTEADREEKAKQLVGGFGDVKLLAVLMRRAKKRCRPLWRTVVARTFQTVGVLILCLIIYVVWFLTGKSVITTNYVAELNRIVRPVADETQNAAPLYEKATELYAKLPKDISALLRKKYNEVTPEEKKLIEKWVADNKEPLDLIIAGAKKPYCWQTYGGRGETTEMMSIVMPNLNRFKRLARALCWRAHLHAEQGRYEDAFGDIKSCYRFGQHIRGDKTLIEQLVGIAIEAIAVQTIQDIISEYQIDSAALATLQQDFEQMIADENFIVSLKFEKLAIYDEIQRCFTEDRLGGGHICLEGFRRYQTLRLLSGKDVSDFTMRLLSVKDVSDFTMGLLSVKDVSDFSLLEQFLAKSIHILFTHPNKQETREMADRYYIFFEKMARKSPAQIHAEGIDIEQQAMEIIKGNLFLEIIVIVPSLNRVNGISHRNKTGVEAALTIIAILRYVQDVGDYPENLDQLIETGYLKELPIDSFSDKPLVYKKTDDNFILYSFGPDFKDDSGVSGKDSKGRVRQWRDNGDTVFWPVAKPQLKQ